jgi:transcriptional regulator with XRE-family HTH domain
MSKLSEWLSNDERRMEFAEEELIVDAAEEIWSAMDKAKVTKSEVAERLGKSKALISQLLNGSRNMTLRTLADIAHCIGFRVHLSLEMQTENAAWGELKGAAIAMPFDKRFLNSVTALEPVENLVADTWTTIRYRDAA